MSLRHRRASLIRPETQILNQSEDRVNWPQSKIPLSRCRQHLQQFQSTARDLLLAAIETQSFTATEGLARGLPLSVSNGTGISKWRFGYGSHSNPTLMPRRFHSVPFVEITAIALQSGHCHLAAC